LVYLYSSDAVDFISDAVYNLLCFNLW